MAVLTFFNAKAGLKEKKKSLESWRVVTKSCLLCLQGLLGV